jgi:hypothetical protein
MDRTDLTELHNITSIDNVPSILAHGILSHDLVEGQDHVSVAMNEIQERRAQTVLPTGRRLHEYACLYIHARNPMLFRLKNLHLNLCVLRISTGVLDIAGVVVTDGNAAADHPRWFSATRGIASLDKDMVFADVWLHPGDPVAYYRHKSLKCAEVLVPDKVTPGYVLGAYVSCAAARATLVRLAPNLNVVVDRHLFFQ